MGEVTRVSVDGLDVERINITMTNKIEPVSTRALSPTDFAFPTIEATFEVDRTTYDHLAGGQLYTVETVMDYNYNPWHRKADTFGQRTRRLRDGLWWTFRKRILRRELIDTARVTVPNCRLVS